MRYIHYYESPIGQILLTADEQGLTGLLLQSEDWSLAKSHQECITPALKSAVSWLDIYFSGNIPDFVPPLRLQGSPFQLEVWELLLKIPYGEVITYGDLAKHIAKNRGIKRMSAQAVGGAVGSNPVSIIVPCHRVIGANGNLTGYASGLDNKIALLKQEGFDMNQFHIPPGK